MLYWSLDHTPRVRLCAQHFLPCFNYYVYVLYSPCPCTKFMFLSVHLQGMKGDKGDEGEKGMVGDQGPKGDMVSLLTVRCTCTFTIPAATTNLFC